jgi:dihydroorotate dehydrogenase electron transfer subunit
MSILDEGDGWRSYMVKPVGDATRELAATRPGDAIAMLHPPEYAIVYGGRTARDVEREVLDDVLGDVLPSTDDGTLGFHGTCVELCVQQLERAQPGASNAVVLTCGPHAMMHALFDAVRDRVRAIHVSLEEIMACGVGVCMGCVARTQDGYIPICTHGPVFAGAEVFGLARETAHE